MIKIIRWLTAVCVATVFSSPAWADDCSYKSNTAPVVMPIPLITANISLGADVAVGSVIHRQYVGSVDGILPVLICNTSMPTITINQYLKLVNLPALVPGWQGIYAGALYQTSLPGVGVAFVNKDGENLDKPFGASDFFKWTYTKESGYQAPVRNKFTLVFVKTGPISAGTINGSQMPTVVLTSVATTPATGLPSETYRQWFTGSINVIVSSCLTPDVNVPMGSYGLEKYFNGKTSATPWVPFNITLTNCPAFYGGYTSDSSPPSYYTDKGSSAGTRSANSFSLMLAPTFGIADSTQGIINIDNASNAAKGVGIQLASGAASNPSPVLLNLAQPLVQNVTSSGPTTQVIPLQARYVSTGGTVTPGPANSKAVFTINYY